MDTIKNNRIITLDFSRGISVMMMILIHTVWMYADQPTKSQSWLGQIADILGKGAPMFLVIMGISFTLSRNRTIEGSIKRGLLILCLGYLLNFLKFIVPIVILQAMPVAFIQAYGWTPPVQLHHLTYLLLTGDILQLAGISLLFLGLIYHYISNKYAIALVAIVIAFCTPYLRGFQPGIPFFDYICDLFWAKNYHVYFPIFPWISFILIGISLGMWYKEKNYNENSLFRIMLPLGFVTASIGKMFCNYNFRLHFGDYFHLGFGGTIYLMGITMCMLWSIYLIVATIKPNRLFNFFYYCSARVTTLYIIQWVLICWGMTLLGFETLGGLSTLLIYPLITMLTLGIQWGIDQLFSSKKKTDLKPHSTIIKQATS